MRIGPSMNNPPRIVVFASIVSLLCCLIASKNVRADGREKSLSDVVQLTEGFERAGEAYFSPDMNWIIFQATPKGEKQYAMYVAKLQRTGERITGAEVPTRISPLNSRNTCGFFSPDGQTLIFASTAGKEKPDDNTTAGYQRQGGTYRWDFPDGMEIFRADDWMKRISATGGDAKSSAS